MQLPIHASKLVHVIPAFNEGGVLARVIEVLCREVPPGLVLVVDDASTDDTGAVAARAGATVIRHPINRGQGAALRTGFDAARKKFVKCRALSGTASTVVLRVSVHLSTAGCHRADPSPQAAAA